MVENWSIDELRERASALPRAPLTELPTPLQECPRFAEELGADVRFFMKRDDLTTLGCGGNKLRKLEFSLGEALANGCDCIVHGLAGQSNYCRQTAAAAAKLGLGCYLVLRKDHKAEDPAQANRLLDYVFGAQVRMVEPGDQQQTKAALVEELKARGHSPYLVGYHDEVLGAVGYALCLAEMLEQQQAAGVEADYVCVTGRSGTLAGLVLGKLLLGAGAEMLAFQPAPGPTGEALLGPTAEMVNDAAALLGSDKTVTVDDIHNTTDYGGDAYGEPTDACMDTMFMLGRTEGLVVGPVYTGKGLSGVVDLVRTGRIEPGSTVVFVHTGGVPETFAYNAEIVARLDAMQRH